MKVLVLLSALLPLASASTVAARAANSTVTDQTALEIIYPRNETYQLEKPLPIVFALHNAPPSDVLGNYSLHWAIAGFDPNGTPGGLTYGRGSLFPRNYTTMPADGAPLFFADFVDLFEVFQTASYDFLGHLELQVNLDQDYDAKRDVPLCAPAPPRPGDYSSLLAVSFRVELGFNGNYRNKDAVPIDLLTATGCPGAGIGIAATTTTGLPQSPSTVTTTATATTTCLKPLVMPTSTQQSECPFTVDASMVSSVSSSISVLMIPPPTPTYTHNRAAAMPIQTGGLAAAGIVGAMMLM